MTLAVPRPRAPIPNLDRQLAVRRILVHRLTERPLPLERLIAVLLDDLGPHLHPDPHPEAQQLSNRQLQVLRRAAEGDTNAEIAAALGLAMETAKHHLYQAQLRLHARNRAHAVAIAIRSGMLAGGR